MPKKCPVRRAPLWNRWQRIDASKIVLIEAKTGKAWTASELSEQASQFAEHLANHGEGERVAFRLPNGPEWMALFLALQRAGLTAVPLDNSLPSEGSVELARKIGARALYMDGALHRFSKGIRKSRNICCVKITSGSNGVPNAVECRAEHLVADGEHIIKTMKIRPGDRNLAVIPLGHSYGLGNLVMPLILQGTSMVCAEEYVPRQLAEWIERHQVTVLPAVPALFRVLAALPAGLKLARLRTAISAGAVLRPEVAQAFLKRHGLKIHNFYGASETGGICYDRTGTASLTGRSVGKPLVGVSVSLRQGRICVRSDAVAKSASRWKLADFGKWTKSGELVLLGRTGRSANIGGKKVHPLEVEGVLRLLPKVTDTVVWTEQEKGRDILAAACRVDTVSRGT